MDEDFYEEEDFDEDFDDEIDELDLDDEY